MLEDWEQSLRGRNVEVAMCANVMLSKFVK